MPPVAFSDHLAGRCIQGSKQRGCTMTFVVMGAAFGLPRSHGKKGLGAIQRLDLGLLVYTENHSSFRRSQIEPYHIPNFFDEERIFRQLESFDAMRLQRKGSPNPAYRRLAQIARPLKQENCRRFAEDFLCNEETVLQCVENALRF
jgi:hypothetical protein